MPLYFKTITSLDLRVFFVYSLIYGYCHTFVTSLHFWLSFSLSSFHNPFFFLTISGILWLKKKNKCHLCILFNWHIYYILEFLSSFIITFSVVMCRKISSTPYSEFCTKTNLLDTPTFTINSCSGPDQTSTTYRRLWRTRDKMSHLWKVGFNDQVNDED